jgi:DNA recombination protein RmuC
MDLVLPVLLVAVLLVAVLAVLVVVTVAVRRPPAHLDPESIAFSAAQAAAQESRATFAALAAEQREHDRVLREGDRALAGSELDRRRVLIDRGLASLTEELGRVTELVRDLDAQRGAKLDVLSGVLQEQRLGVAELARTTADLREALSSTRARGQWGERMAEDVLTLAGFLEGVQYVKQKAVTGGTGIPDFTFLMPGDRVLYMDVKFPFDNYLRYLETTDAAEEARHRSAFLRDVRAKVKELAQRRYQASGGSPLDCVLLFIPNEQLYTFVQEHDPGVLDDALTHQIVMCSPLTLFAVLAVVRQAVDSFRTERAANEILAVLGGFREQWDRYVERVDVLGRQLETARRSYDELAGPRRRQLERQLDRVDDLRRAHGLAGDAPAALDDPELEDPVLALDA